MSKEFTTSPKAKIRYEKGLELSKKSKRVSINKKLNLDVGWVRRQ